MATTLLSEKELRSLFIYTMNYGCKRKVVSFLKACHGEDELDSCAPFFRKSLMYGSYDFTIYDLRFEGESVSSAIYQFRKKFKFKFLRDREDESLCGILKNLAGERYGQKFKCHEGRRNGATFWHYGNSKTTYDPSDMEAWQTETLITYEPNSTGQNWQPDKFHDFIIFRFVRRFFPDK